jgi:hypothetical protein
VVSAGDLRINAPVGNDPIGMLANAFNFTVGRFRRFVLRTQTTIEQVEVISRQELERAENFAITLNTPSASNFSSGQNPVSLVPNTRPRMESGEHSNSAALHDKDLLQNIQISRERLQKLNNNEGFTRHIRAISGLTEQISLTANKLIRSMPNQNPETMRTPSGSLAQTHVQELRMLETMLQRLTLDLQSTQRGAANDLLELDNSLAQLNNSLLTSRTVSTDHSATQRSKDASPELIRQGQGLANDIIALARKLTALTQEMRAAVVSFQLDTNDPSLVIDPMSSQYAVPFGSNTHNSLSGTANRSAPLPTIPENVSPLRPSR